MSDQEINETEITKFDVTVAELNAIVAETKSIVDVDLDNTEELKKVKEARKSLGRIRIDLKKFGKSKRDWFNEMSGKIMKREKELVAIVSEEEDRLSEFENEVAKRQLIADRKAVLPQRKFQLENIKDEVEVTDEFICSLDASQFMEYSNKRISDKNEKIRLELEDREAELHKEEREIERKAEIQKAEERVREQERLRADKQEKERVQAEKQKEEERVRTEKQKEEDERQRVAQEEFNLEQKAIKEAKELEENTKYQAWLESVGCTNNDKLHTVKVGDKLEVYKLVGVYEN